MSNTITAYFKGRVGVAEALYQNDYGIVMQFDGIDLPAHFDCYFSVSGAEEAIPGVGSDSRVAIPNAVLANSGKVVVHIPLHTGANDSEVEYIVYFKVIGRARPIDDGTPTQMTAIERALALLRSALSKWTNMKVSANTLDPWSAATADYSEGELTLGIPKGDPGVGITSVGFDEDNRLTLVLTDGQSATSEPITEKVNINAFLIDFSKKAILQSAEDTSVPLDMYGYEYSAEDKVFVFVNGAYCIPGIDYTIDSSGEEALISITKNVSASDVVAVRVIKARLDFELFVDSMLNEIVTSDNDSLMI